jgi:hypothetical protein
MSRLPSRRALQPQPIRANCKHLTFNRRDVRQLWLALTPGDRANAASASLPNKTDDPPPPEPEPTDPEAGENDPAITSPGSAQVGPDFSAVGLR